VNIISFEIFPRKKRQHNGRTDILPVPMLRRGRLSHHAQ